MLKTFIIIYRIISGAELNLAEGPTGHKFHILSGQMNRNINEKRLSLSYAYQTLYSSRLLYIFAKTFVNTIILLDTLRYNRTYRLIQTFTNVFYIRIYI